MIRRFRLKGFFSPGTIDAMFVKKYEDKVGKPIRVTIKAFHTLTMGLFTIHAGANGRMVQAVSGVPQLIVPEDIRLHRVRLPRGIDEKVLFEDNEGYNHANPLDSLGIYDYDVHKHTLILAMFDKAAGRENVTIDVIDLSL